ncbi:ATP-binding cassette domain-containing protein, partial [Alphaproteobacteria bacterium]|nr:ATP-binding cassette domain-containing protein [Alphaproteobacteria bacterium]
MKSINVEINGNFSSLSFDFKHNFDSGITTLLGHIGSGKSTIVDSISGFNRQLKSIVNINGDVFDSHIPSKINLRPISVMFQDTRLIPHMNVKENISFALKKSKIKKTNSETLDVEHIIQSLGIKELLNKFPDQLSGGQKQLVNLCRTLAIKSDFIILDEPMSSLDIKNKTTVLSLLKEINKKYEIPILIISHSVEEIAQISD